MARKLKETAASNALVRNAATWRVKKTLKLRRSRVLEAFDDAELNTIADICPARHVPAGEVLCRQGEPSHSLFLLVAGAAQVPARGAPRARWAVSRALG